MNEKIVSLITDYGLEAVVLGLAINVLTGLIKLPIKAFAKRLEGYEDEIQYVDRLTELPWGQKMVRFYDPDGNLIEVRSSAAGGE